MVPTSPSRPEFQYADIFIIGGGVNGVGIAADAAGRGLKVILSEQGDLASGTSSASSKVIHGGLRYLEQYDFKLVRKALKEREILLYKAPHIINPMLFVLPYIPSAHHSWMGWWMLRLGLWLYDHLAKRHYLPASHAIKLIASEYGAALKSTITEGFIYSDCWTDDARLVVLNALAAAENGADIYTYQRVIKAERIDNEWAITTLNSMTHQEHHYRARLLINATGPWLEQTQHFIQAKSVSVELVKGSHIVVPKLFSGKHAYLLINTDKRVVFAIPYLNHYTLIGTTEIAYAGDPHDVHIEDDEILYLCAAVNRYFQHQISSEDIVWSYSGVRPLQAQTGQDLSAISRDYQLKWDAPSKEQAPLLSIIGGKITTYRELAEQALKETLPYFPKMGVAWTAKAHLPGGDLPQEDLSLFISSCQHDYSWLPKELCERYARAYGTRIHLLLANTLSLADLGSDFGCGLYQKEVEYLLQYEWAKTAEDILWRRTKLGITFDQKMTVALAEFIHQRQNA
jgi:glycerol-3-phosphate dehydrogenase